MKFGYGRASAVGDIKSGDGAAGSLGGGIKNKKLAFEAGLDAVVKHDPKLSFFLFGGFNKNFREAIDGASVPAASGDDEKNVVAGGDVKPGDFRPYAFAMPVLDRDGYSKHPVCDSPREKKPKNNGDEQREEN